MPIYEYRCAACGHQFEIMQKFSDDPIKVCPSCEAEEVKKLLSAPAFHLKGSGWYKDHYGLKSGGGTSEAAPSSKGSAAAPSSGESTASSTSDTSSASGASAAGS